MDEIMNDPSLKEVDNSFKNMETPTDAKINIILSFINTTSASITSITNKRKSIIEALTLNMANQKQQETLLDMAWRELKELGVYEPLRNQELSPTGTSPTDAQAHTQCTC